MPNIIYSNEFIEDVRRIYSQRILADLNERLADLESFPKLGSASMPANFIKRFGGNVRKFPAPPFMIVYRYEESNETIEFLALPYEKQIS